MITAQHVKAYAPRARPEYVDALTSPESHRWMSAYSILDSIENLCGFLATGGHETGGFTIIRENMSYTTTARLRAVWPSRFGRKSDAELRRLLRNPEALSEAVYAGRMGNRPGTGDAFNFRGGGMLQTTGRDDYELVSDKIGVDLIGRPELIEEMEVMLSAACVEWGERGCNQMMQHGSFVAASCIINVGIGAYRSFVSRGFSSAQIAARVVGMDDRNIWYRNAKRVFGGEGGVLEVPAAILEYRENEVDDTSTPGQVAHWTDDEETLSLVA